jgi:hypothetical protein
MNAPLTRRQMDEHNHAIAVMCANRQTPPTFAELVAAQEQALADLERAIDSRDLPLFHQTRARASL